MTANFFYGCNPNTANYDYKEPCIFKGVSPCYDQVHHKVCNAHLSLFGLICKSASYHNGKNDVRTTINTYATSPRSVNIPLFLDKEGTLMMDEIRTFTLNARHTHPGINVQVFAKLIACNLGFNMFALDDCEVGGWLSDTNSRVIIRDPANAAVLWGNAGSGFFERTKFPYLHKVLFYYVRPSNTVTSTGDDIYYITTLSLTVDSSGRLSFVTPNEDILLKWTEADDCVATPLALDAIRKTDGTNNALRTNRINPNLGFGSNRCYP